MKLEEPGETPDPVAAPEEYADHLFDTVSGALRHRAEPGAWAHLPGKASKTELWEAHAAARAQLGADSAVVRADEAFQRLHDWIVSGQPLPSPWRKHYTPRLQD